MALDPRLVTTAFELPNSASSGTWACTRHHRSLADIVGTIGAGLQSLVGRGEHHALHRTLERRETMLSSSMIAHGTDAGANAIIGVRYNANEIAAEITEVLAYGTAVVVEPVVR